MNTFYRKLLYVMLFLTVLVCIDCSGIFFDYITKAEEPLPAENLSKWNSMTPEQRERLRENYRLWKDLNEADKTKLDQKLREFKALSRDEQKRVRDNYSLFINMDAVQQKMIIKRYEKWLQLTKEQQQLLQERYLLLKEMHPEEQEQFYENYEMWKRLSDQKKNELLVKWNTLSPEQQQAFMSKRAGFFSYERRLEIKKILKRIRKERMEKKLSEQPAQNVQK
jgi:hypothetical protein